MDIDIEKLAKAAASGFDLSNFKGDVVGVKIVENEFGTIEEGGIGVQNIYSGEQSAEEKSIAEVPIPEVSEIDTEEELREGTMDEHTEAFTEAMLKMQDAFYRTKPMPEQMIKNKYDWYAVQRMGMDIGILNGWEDLIAILHDNKKFREIPANYQNFSAYKQYISDNYPFPNWQCEVAERSYFNKFLSIAETTYTIYKQICKQKQIKAY